MDKVCRTCKETKDISKFSIASSGKKGVNFRLRKRTLKTTCKSCDAAYARAFRKKNKNYTGSGKITKYVDRALASAVGARIIEAKARSKKHNLPIDIDKDFLIDLFQSQQGKCAISAKPLVIIPKQLNTLSLDKIDPSKGYTKDNVQWLCWAVNRAKGDMTQQMFLNMCRTITEKCNDYPKREYTQASGSAQPLEIG